MFCLHIELFGSVCRILNTMGFCMSSALSLCHQYLTWMRCVLSGQLFGVTELMTGSIEAAAPEEVCLLGVSWTPEWAILGP